MMLQSQEIAVFRLTGKMDSYVSILEHIAEGCGVRETSRLVGVHRDDEPHYQR